MKGESHRSEDSDHSLPVEIVRTPGGLELRRLFLVTAGIVIFVNFIALVYLRNFPANPGYWLIRHKWRMLLDLQKPVDWLILGDSSAGHGIVPQTFESVLNTTSINLSTIGDMTFVGDVWMLEAYIRKFGPPRNVLIMRVYDSWHRDIEPSVIAQVPSEWANQILFNAEIPCNLRCKGSYLLARLFPLFSENTSLSRVIKNPTRLFQRPFRLEEGGYSPLYEAQPDRVLADVQLHIRDYSKRAFQFSETNRTALQELTELSDHHGFNVYFAAAPLYESLFRDERIQPYYREVWNAILSLTSGNSRIHCIPHVMTFSANHLTSVDHLVHPAAELFTRTLAEKIHSIRTTESKATQNGLR